MLTRDGLVGLQRTLHSDRVLSVYLNGEFAGAQNNQIWRRQLDHSLKDLRTELSGSSREERKSFEGCVELLLDLLGPRFPATGSPGWVAFITPGKVWHAGGLPAPAPTLAVWGKGICVAPHVRALKQLRPAIVIVADSRRGDVYRYVNGEVQRVASVHAHAQVEQPSHMSAAPRAGFHSGVRGTPGHDDAQRSLLAGTERMLSEVIERALGAAGRDGWLLAGGVPAISARAVRGLTDRAPGRVLQLSSLDIHSSEAQVAAAAAAGASSLRDEWDAMRISEVIERAGAGGAASFGAEPTQAALQQGRVHELYLTAQYFREHTADAEEAVRAALEQGAMVEEVEREAARVLDDHGGIAARLRYALHEAPLLAVSEPA